MAGHILKLLMYVHKHMHLNIWMRANYMLGEGIASNASVLGYTKTLLQVIVPFMWNLRTIATFFNLVNWKLLGFFRYHAGCVGFDPSVSWGSWLCPR